MAATLWWMPLMSTHEAGGGYSVAVLESRAPDVGKRFGIAFELIQRVGPLAQLARACMQCYCFIV